MQSSIAYNFTRVLARALCLAIFVAVTQLMPHLVIITCIMIGFCFFLDSNALSDVNAVHHSITPHTSSRDRIRKIRIVSEALAKIGPYSQVEDVHKAVVDASLPALGTDLVSLFNIDPFTGSIISESSDSVSDGVKSMFLSLYGHLLSDTDQRDAWIVTRDNTTNVNIKKLLQDNGIYSIIAAPIRSEICANGALVAYYTDIYASLEDNADIIEAIAAQASTTLSFILALEQSRCLLDDLAGANQELSLQATMDGLTGLYNHRTLQQTLNDLCKRSSNHTFSLVMVDVDHFKIYNDTYGHQEGDNVLRKVAKLMSSKLRQGDIAARYGGEEFALVLHGVDKNGALCIADRIRRTVAEESFHQGSVTVSMGVAEFPIDGGTPSEVIERADRALYHAKITGRNRVVVWGIEGCSLVHEPDNLKDDKQERSILIIEGPGDNSSGTIKKSLASSSCVIEVVKSVVDAIEMLRAKIFDIALLNYEALPEDDMKAISMLSSINANMPVVLITKDLSVEDSREALRKGASDILLRPFNAAEIPVVIERNLERRRLERQRMMNKSTELMLQAIHALVAAIDAKDPFTAGHSHRVSAISLAISDELDISSEERYALELAAMLHDIGKIVLPESVLSKESPLTEEEWHAMREHPIQGSKIVGAIDELAYVSTIIRHHHERLDGTGYPDGLRGPAIPLLARIIAVADAYEAMTSERAHRGCQSPAEAIHELWRCAGIYYSPEIIQALENQLTSFYDKNNKLGRNYAA